MTEKLEHESADWLGLAAIWNTVLNQDNPLCKHQIHYITSQQNKKLEKLFYSIVFIVRKW